MAADLMDLEERVGRLARVSSSAQTGETSRVTATGAVQPAWVVEVVSHVAYNEYRVRQVMIQSSGTAPVAVGGSERSAFNVAESFTAVGGVAAGTHAVMWRAGDQHVFYAQP